MRANPRHPMRNIVAYNRDIKERFDTHRPSHRRSYDRFADPAFHSRGRNIEADSGVLRNMRKRWRVVLPIIGIILFNVVTYHSLQAYRESPSRYFWWSSIRLDSEPSNKRNGDAIPCQEGKENRWELRTKWVDPGFLEQFLMLSALPTFVVGGFAVLGLGTIGISQVSSFMFLTPMLICA